MIYPKVPTIYLISTTGYAHANYEAAALSLERVGFRRVAKPEYLKHAAKCRRDEQQEIEREQEEERRALRDEDAARAAEAQL